MALPHVVILVKWVGASSQRPRGTGMRVYARDDESRPTVLRGQGIVVVRHLHSLSTESSGDRGILVDACRSKHVVSHDMFHDMFVHYR